MTTAAKGFRYEFKRHSLGTGTLASDFIFVNVPMGSNYFVFVNQIYKANVSSPFNLIAFGNSSYIQKDFNAAGANYETLSGAEGFVKYEFTMLSALPLAEEQYEARIIMPGERLRLSASESDSNSKYIEYTQVYFGGLSEAI